MAKNIPSKYTAAALAILLGTIGLHQIYLRNNSPGAVWLIVAILLSWTVVVPVTLAMIGLLQGISYLFWNEAEWEKRFS